MVVVWCAERFEDTFLWLVLSILSQVTAASACERNLHFGGALQMLPLFFRQI